MDELNSESPPTTVSLSLRMAKWIVEIFPRLLGALLIFTAIQKIRQPDSLRAVFAFDGLPQPIVGLAIWAVILLELVLGAMLLIFAAWRRAILLATGCLLMVYIAQLGYLLLQNQAPSCGCLGADTPPDQSQTTNLLSLLRNVCLLWPVFWVWRQLSPARRKI